MTKRNTEALLATIKDRDAARAERDAAIADRDDFAGILTRIATHENLDECCTGGLFSLDRAAVERVRAGLVEAGYLRKREEKA